MTLQAEIDKERADIRTDSYSMSIGELLSMYEKGELTLRPEYQRLYRWTITQKSRFIESILLGIPLPAIFVFQQKNGAWEVIDGLQRVSTILEFMGELKDESGNKREVVLETGEYLPSLKGKRWDSKLETDPNVLTSAQKLYFRRAKVYVNILLRESDERSKFALFRRLNTGGSPLVEQEVRNCVLLMENRELFNWMSDLMSNKYFQETIDLSDRLLEEQFDMELLTRFIVLRRREQLLGIGDDLSEFLTDEMVKIANDKTFNMVREAKAFKSTFEWIYNELGEGAFRRYDSVKKRFLGPFSQVAFEAIAIGVGYYAEKTQPTNIEASAKKLWSDRTIKRETGGGVSSATRIPRTIGYGRKLFKPA